MNVFRNFFELTKNDALALKGFACVGVVFSHIDERFSDFGFLFVALFFFLSGCGFRLRSSPITFRYAFEKVYPIIFAFALVSLPSFFFGGFSWIPPAWFMCPYSLILFGLCVFDSRIVFLLVGALCLWGGSAHYAWGASWIFFFVGFWFGRFRFLSWILPFVLASLFAFWANAYILVCWVFASVFIFAIIACKRIFKPFFLIGRFSIPIWVIHCLPLALLGLNPWLNGGIFLYFH